MIINILTKVGVIVLITFYMVSGAAMFHNIEHDSLLDIAQNSLQVIMNFLIQNKSSCNNALTLKYNHF